MDIINTYLLLNEVNVQKNMVQNKEFLDGIGMGTWIAQFVRAPG